MFKICDDPGHNKITIGAVGLHGLREVDVVLNIGKRVGYHLQRHNVGVVYTRTNDIPLTPDGQDLAQRVLISDKNKCDYFISIHLNSNADRTANGTETFCYKKGGKGEVLASKIQKELVAALGREDRGVSEGNFEVLRDTDCPAALVEVVFVSNPEEEAFIGHAANQEKAAVGIAKGILKQLGIAWVDEEPIYVYASKPTEPEKLGIYLREDYAKNKCKMLEDEGYVNIYYIDPNGKKIIYK